MKSLCHVEALEDDEGHVVINRSGEPKLKMPNPQVELSYTNLVA